MVLRYEFGRFSIPSRGFWFFEVFKLGSGKNIPYSFFQSPRGDFGFLKLDGRGTKQRQRHHDFQSPRGDFGFLKAHWNALRAGRSDDVLFNPLAGILVF